MGANVPLAACNQLGLNMRHYIPMQSQDGAAWLVCYGNHRGEFVAVMECNTIEAAYRESAAMTAAAFTEGARLLAAQPGAASVATGGNRYLRAAA